MGPLDNEACQRHLAGDSRGWRDSSHTTATTPSRPRQEKSAHGTRQRTSRQWAYEWAAGGRVGRCRTDRFRPHRQRMCPLAAGREGCGAHVEREPVADGCHGRWIRRATVREGAAVGEVRPPILGTVPGNILISWPILLARHPLRSSPVQSEGPCSLSGSRLVRHARDSVTGRPGDAVPSTRRSS